MNEHIKPMTEQEIRKIIQEEIALALDEQEKKKKEERHRRFNASLIGMGL